MKKLLLTTALVAGAAASTMAALTGAVAINNQNFSETEPIAALNPVYYLSAGTQAAGDVYIEVFGGADASSLTSIATTTASFEPLVGCYLFDNGGFGLITGTTPGQDVTLKIRAWTGAATWDAATAKAESATWTRKSTGLDPENPTAMTPDSTFNVNLPALTMTTGIIPEPTTIALAMLGGAALFLRRRQ